MNQQLEEQEQVTAEIQQTNHSLQKQVEQLQQQLTQQNLKPPQPRRHRRPRSQVQARGRQLQKGESLKQLPVQQSLPVDHKPALPKVTLHWREGARAPSEMSRGATVVDGDMTYFMNRSGEMCAYNSTSKIWTRLPNCPYEGSSLAVVNGQLTAIGGYKDMFNKYIYSDKLLRLPDCKEVFPPMPTKRQDTTAVTSKEHLIVAGGMIGVNSATGTIKYNTVTVEVMDTKTLTWSTVASLPYPYCYASGTICGYRIFMLGGNDNKGKTKSVLTCTLTELLL